MPDALELISLFDKYAFRFIQLLVFGIDFFDSDFDPFLMRSDAFFKRTLLLHERFFVLMHFFFSLTQSSPRLIYGMFGFRQLLLL